jgi:site-specific DNA-methyltransferase (adenine-specific)
MLYHGDSSQILKQIPDNSIDSIVTDPPAGIAFMGKDFDRDKGGRDQWIAWLSSIMQECLRVIKPGGHMLVWELPRTSHWTTTAIENAGFEIRDMIVHLQSQGFPKCGSIGKNLEGEDAVKWQGWSTSLKPAAEFWILARKPIDQKTVSQNVLKWGTGGLNIEECRVSTNDNLNGGAYAKSGTERNDGWHMERGGAGEFSQPSGRWPANTVLSHSDGCQKVGTKIVKSGIAVNENRNPEKTKNVYGDFNNMQGENKGYGNEEVDKWECVEGCPVKLLDEQSGILKSGAQGFKKATSKGHQGNCYGKDNRPEGTPSIAYADEGGASRFFKTFEPFIYKSKANKSDKGKNNTHPTVKSTQLMEYLVTLITPPNGIVLDPFMGSGSTGVASIRCSLKFIGIEMEEEYFEIAKQRINNVNEL